jgi:protein-tyrosine kinase
MKMSVPALPDMTGSGRSIGDIFLENGLLKPEDIEHVIAAQKKYGLRFGDAAVRVGLLGPADVQYALSRQFSYPYLRKTAGGKPAVSEELVSAYQPFSTQVEQLRSIRSQLTLRWFSKVEQRQILSVVGTQRREGRSHLAANLAVVFAQLGERTLLVDADMRNPRQHELFYLENKIGLSTLLSGRARDEAIVRIPDLAGLCLLPAGPVPPNPLELLSRLNFDEFMLYARSAFDVVILDTPALSVGEDAAMIAVRTGAALVVARSEHTRMGDFTELVTGLTDAGVNVVGSVLNEVPMPKALKEKST